MSSIDTVKFPYDDVADYGQKLEDTGALVTFGITEAQKDGESTITAKYSIEATMDQEQALTTAIRNMTLIEHKNIEKIIGTFSGTEQQLSQMLTNAFNRQDIFVDVP